MPVASVGLSSLPGKEALIIFLVLSFQSSFFFSVTQNEGSQIKPQIQTIQQEIEKLLL